MKREVKDLDFFFSPVTEIDDHPNKRGIRETGVPYYPKDGNGLKENAEPVPNSERVKRIIKKAAIITIAALFVGFAVVWLFNNPELFKLAPTVRPFSKW